MAARSYESTRTDPVSGSQNNLVLAPSDWLQLLKTGGLNSTSLQGGLGHAYSDSGFEGVAFQKGNEVVISFAGTNFNNPRGDYADLFTDASVGFGFNDQQIYN